MEQLNEIEELLKIYEALLKFLNKAKSERLKHIQKSEKAKKIFEVLEMIKIMLNDYE